MNLIQENRNNILKETSQLKSKNNASFFFYEGFLYHLAIVAINDINKTFVQRIKEYYNDINFEIVQKTVDRKHNFFQLIRFCPSLLLYFSKLDNFNLTTILGNIEEIKQVILNANEKERIELDFKMREKYIIFQPNLIKEILEKNNRIEN